MSEYGLCECGCGEKTSVASVNIKSRGQVKGRPVRFIHGHAGRNHTAEARAKMSEANKGKKEREKNHGGMAVGRPLMVVFIC